MISISSQHLLSFVVALDLDNLCTPPLLTLCYFVFCCNFCAPQCARTVVPQLLGGWGGGRFASGGEGHRGGGGGNYFLSILLPLMPLSPRMPHTTARTPPLPLSTQAIVELESVLQPVVPLSLEAAHDPGVLFDLHDLCQAFRDVLNVGEAACGNVYNAPPAVQYAVLGCHVEPLPADSAAYQSIAEQVGADGGVKAVRSAWRVHKYQEHVGLRRAVGNAQLLYHGSPMGNWVGILSRGLQVPRFAHRRRDAGMLGCGLYFGSEAGTALKYTTPGHRGTCFLAVCEVCPTGSTWRREVRWRRGEWEVLERSDLSGALEGWHGWEG